MQHVPFHKLLVWSRGMQLAKRVYEITRKFPPEERYGLSSQLRRAAVAIPSNIAEGSQRSTDRDFLQFLRIAKGSLAEIETQIILSCDFGYLAADQKENVMNEVSELSKMLRSFIATVTVRSSRSSPL